DPGDLGLPLVDAGSYTITNQYTSGYWVARAKNSFSTTDYDINLDATGFGPYPVTAGSRVIRRTGFSDWTLDGSHAGVTGSIVSRTSMIQTISGGTDGTHFCIGRTGPIITSQPTGATLCQNDSNPTVFSVGASGYGSLSYKWYKEPGILLTDDGHYVGTNTNSFGINNAEKGDAGIYYCIITDERGESIETVHVELYIPSIAFGYGYSVDLNVSQASGPDNLHDFPLLVNITRDFLRTVANGGHVFNTNG